jgi:hypothetical protein
MASRTDKRGMRMGGGRRGFRFPRHWTLIKSLGPLFPLLPPPPTFPTMPAATTETSLQNGRLVTYSMRRPVDIDHLFRDPDTPLPVMLIAIRTVPHSPRDSHWKLAWKVGKSNTGVPVHREISLVRNTLQDYMSWGPITRTAEEYTRAVEITQMSLSNRKRLEKIASDAPLHRPNGKAPCQDWIVSVLEAAEKQGLLSRSDWTAAVRAVADV